MGVRDIVNRSNEFGRRLFGLGYTYKAAGEPSQDFEIGDLDDDTPGIGTSATNSPSITRKLYVAVHLRKFKLLLLVFIALVIVGIHVFLMSRSRIETHSEPSEDFTVPSSLTSSARSMKPLKTLCERTSWQDGLVFSCDVNPGGVGNVASMILSCLRYAIHAGAGIILPKITLRATDDLKLLEGPFVDMPYMFDVEWFMKQMSQNCPEMPIYRNVGEIQQWFKAYIPAEIDSRHLQLEDYVLDVKSWPAALQQVLETVPTLDSPVIVRLHPGPFDFPAHEVDSLEFWAAYGQLLRFRADVRQLAESALQRLKEMAGPDGYLGIHLRTEKDVAQLPLAAYGPQKDAAFEIAQEEKLKFMYAASGDKEQLRQLVSDAQSHGISVLTKEDVLDRQDLDILHSLTWDQQALVDYILLRHSTYFQGVSLSSFSMSVAYMRHLDIAEEQYPFPGDAHNRIMGKDEPAFYKGLWPVQGL